MNWKHIQNVKENRAQMFLYTDIGGDKGVNGQSFAYEMKWLNENDVDIVDIHINSGGGSVLDGLSIMRAMQTFDGTVNTVIDGVAASIAGVLSMGGQHRSMVDFGRFMIHNPSFSDDSKMDDKKKKALNEIREILLTVFQKNTNIDSDKLDEIMSDETWIDAQTALDLGLIDEIIDTSREYTNALENTNDIAAMVNRANTIHQEIKNHSKMKEIKNTLELAENADENKVVDAIKNIQDRATDAEKAKNELSKELETVKTEKTDVSNKLDEANNTIAALNKTIAENAVDSAIKAGKIKDDSRDAMVEKATKDIEAFNALVDAIATKPARIVNNIDTGDGGNGETKTFREMEKENPKALNEMKKNDPEKWAEMFKNEYGVEPSF